MEWVQEQDGFFTPPRYKWTSGRWRVWGRDDDFAVSLSRGRVGKTAWSKTFYTVERDLPSPEVAKALAEELQEVLNRRTGMVMRMEPPEGSEPDGPGPGNVWVPQVGVTFIATGAYVRSLLDMTSGREGQGLVGIDVAGKWNHAAKDTLSIITTPDMAEEWGRFLIEVAAAAREDQARAMGGT